MLILPMVNTFLAIKMVKMPQVISRYFVRPRWGSRTDNRLGNTEQPGYFQ